MRIFKYLIVFYLSIGTIWAQSWNGTSRWAQYRTFSSKSVASAGGSHTLFIRQGDVYSWGLNDYGQLGILNNINQNAPNRTRGIGVSETTPDPIIAVEAGDKHSMALSVAGVVYCWGANYDGQLGQSTFDSNTNHWQPGTPAIFANAVAIAAGKNHSLSLDISGRVDSWGANSLGQCGLGYTSANEPSATQVSVLDSIVAIAAGGDHNLALRVDGTVWAWGANGSGQLGDGTLFDRSTPIEITDPDINNIVAIACGDSNSYAIRADGKLFAWGANGMGQLGIGSFSPGTTSPDSVPGLSNIESISAGGNHVTVRRADGALLAWGDNSNGQLGDNTTTTRTSPVTIGGVGLINTLYAGGSHTIVLEADGDIQAFGENASGQLGDASFTQKTSPSLTSFVMEGVVMVGAGSNHSLALKTDGKAYSWGYNNRGQLGDGTGTGMSSTQHVTVTGLDNVISVAAGGNVSMALKADGTVWFWGENASGQEGNGSTDSDTNDIPVQIGSLSNIVAIRVGTAHSAAISADGKLYIWGNNNYGAVGNGLGSGYVTTPYHVSSLSNVIDVDCGLFHTVALDASGQAYGIGGNDDGQVGDGSITQRDAPVMVSGNAKFMDVAAGWYHSLGVNPTGKVKSWGRNTDGQLGDNGLSGDSSNVPTNVNSGNIKGVSAGSYYSKFLSSFGQLRACGWNTPNGVLGDSVVNTKEYSPILSNILDFITQTKVIYDYALSTSSGSFHALSLQANWQVASIGKNVDGQLGTGNNVMSLIYNGNCTINCFTPPSPANAGTDTVQCDKTSIALSGSLPPDDSYVLWTKLNGGSTILSETSQNTTATNPTTGLNRFEYSITVPGCGINSDTISIRVNDQKADAGNDDEICVGSSYNLDANAPLSAGGSGTWNIISATGSITTPSDPNSSISGQSGESTNIFEWALTELSCPTTYDTVIISVRANPTASAIVTPDQTLCENTSTTIQGNVPSIGAGQWSIKSQSGLSTIEDVDSVTTVMNLVVGWNYGYWTITNGPCPVSIDSVLIDAQANPLNPDAGANDSICVTQPSVTLNGNDPNPYSGTWSVISGSGTFGNDTVYNTTVTGYAAGNNLYEWRLNNSICSSADTMLLIAKSMPTVADAGGAGAVDTFCYVPSFVFSLDGNTATTGNGYWNILAPGTGVTINERANEVSVCTLSVGTLNRLEWTITSAPCPVSRDTVEYFPICSPIPADAGLDDVTCDTFYTLSGNDPGVCGSGQWTFVQGCGRTNPDWLFDATVDSLCYGDNTLAWTVTNAGKCESSDTVVITVTPPSEIAIYRLDTTNNLLSTDFGLSNIQWYRNGAPILGANSNTYDMNDKEDCGFYHVEATVDANGGCKGISDTVEFCPIGIMEPSEELSLKTEVVPNPTFGKVTIVLDQSLDDEFEVEVLNAIGKQIYSNKLVGRKETLDLTDYVNGLYYIRISQDQSYTVKKLVKY